MALPDVVLCRPRAGSVRVRPGFRRSRAYRTYRAQVAEARTYEQLLALLERLAATPAPALRAGAVLDFAPGVAYARQFVNSTAAFRVYPPTDPRRHLAERAWKALGALASAAGVHPGGRPSVAPLTAAQHAHIRERRAAWVQVVRPIWTASGVDPTNRVRGLLQASRDRLPAARAYHDALTTLIRREKCRPVDVANQLTAWELALPVRRVRESLASERAWARCAAVSR